MALLTLHRKQLMKVGIPLWVFVNGQTIGIMRGKEVSVELPDGVFDISVRIMLQLFKWRFSIGGTARVDIHEDEHLTLEITDKERWWNLIFDIDLILCILKWFIYIPSPWGFIYEIISDGFFAIWLFRIWLIRDRYYIINEISKSTKFR